MGYTHEQLHKMTYDELCSLSVDDILERAPVRGLGFPPIVIYACKHCGNSIEGAERTVRNWRSFRETAGIIKSVTCPYCKETLWTDNGKQSLRTTAYREGHFERERKKRHLRYLKADAKRKIR